MHTPSTRLNDPLWCSHGAAARGVGWLVGQLWREKWLYLWITANDREGFWALKAGRFDLALRAVGGGWSSFGSCGRVLKVEWWYFK